MMADHTASSELAEDAADWVEALDERSGRKFYANVKTGEAVWEMPLVVRLKKERDGEVEWWELFDERRNLPYYYNTLTGETEWSIPTGVTPIKIKKRESIHKPPAVPEEAPPPGPVPEEAPPPAFLNNSDGSSKEVVADSPLVPPPNDDKPDEATPDHPLNGTSTPSTEENGIESEEERLKKEQEFKEFLDRTSRYSARKSSNALEPHHSAHTISFVPQGGEVPGLVPPIHAPLHRPTNPLPLLPQKLSSSDTLPSRNSKQLPSLPFTNSADGLHASSPPMIKNMPSVPPPSAPLPTPPPSHPPAGASPRPGSMPKTFSSPHLNRTKDNVDMSKVASEALASRLLSGRPGSPPEGPKIIRVMSQTSLPNTSQHPPPSKRDKRASTVSMSYPPPDDISRGREKEKEKHKDKEKEKDNKEKKKGKFASLRYGRLGGKSKKVVGPEGQKILTRDILVEINKFQLEDYAKKFFTARKKGLFRRRLPVKEILMFERKPITAPLLKMHRPDLVKASCAIFKKILMYQGLLEHPEEPDLIVIARDIVSEGIRDGQLRDEIYCQICKQTCYTPTEELLYRGWELMIYSCLTFPPTQNFEEWLRKYIAEHTRSDTKEAAYAKFCLRKLDLTCRAGPRGRIPSLVELRLIKDCPFVTSPFGADFDEIMDQQKDTHPDLKVPLILVTLCDAVLDLGGMQIEGIFRIPADMEPLYDLKAEIESGNYTIKVNNANTPASLLKLWLRELASPLIPEEFYDACLAAVGDPEESIKIVKRLPEINQKVLCFLVRFLQIVADPENQKKTKMTVNNLAMIFAPNFLRCVSDQAQTIINNAKIEQDFVKNLILHLDTSENLS